MLETRPILSRLIPHIFLRPFLHILFPPHHIILENRYQMQVYMLMSLPSFLTILHTDIIHAVIDG